MGVVVLLLAAPGAGGQVAARQPVGVTVESPAVAASRPVDARYQELESRAIRARGGGSGLSLPGLGGQGRSTGTASLWLQTAVVLAVVLGAMWFVLKWLRKAGFAGSFGGSNAAVQVLNRGYLTSKHQMVLVRFGGRILLLGVSPQNVAVLSELCDPQEAAQVLAKVEAARPGSASQDFQQVMTAASQEYIEQPAAASELAAVTPSQEQISAIRSEIRGLLAKMQSLGKKPAE